MLEFLVVLGKLVQFLGVPLADAFQLTEGGFELKFEGAVVTRLLV